MGTSTAALESARTNDQVYSVSDITGIIKDLLEHTIPRATVEGEISNWRPSATGHCYFRLKDSGAVLDAVMFRGRAAALAFKPADGMLVRATGSLSVYAQRGNYQLVVDAMSASGEGAILQLLEDRKRRLAAEGLFELDRKRPLPAYPDTIAVITSPTGAALRDILQIARRRNPGVNVTVLPCPVQGVDASAVIVRRLRAANTWHLGDVIILGRGGGSLEDLLPFSDEAVVRAVAASSIPVVSAVGHEIDWALSDYAADLRAPTPSAAAEIVVPERSAIRGTVTASASLLERIVRGKLDQARLLLKAFTPASMELQFRAIEQPLLSRLQDALDALGIHMQNHVELRRRRIDDALRDLKGANPQGILDRGYAMVRDKGTGKIIRSFRDTEVGGTLEIIPAQGRIDAAVTSLAAKA
jgi:exodeoxyribonuclease VII large subunit